MEKFGDRHEKPSGPERLDSRGLQAKLKEAISNFYAVSKEFAADESGKVIPDKAVQAAVLASAMSAAAPMLNTAMNPHVEIAAPEKSGSVTRIRITPNNGEKLSKQDRQKMREQSSLSQKDVEELSLLVYREAGAEPALGKLAVAQVAMNRFLNGKHGETLHDVIFEHKGKRWQFDGVNDTEMRTPAQVQDESKEVPELVKVFQKAATGKSAKEITDMLAEVTGLPQNVEYYKHIQLDENDPNTTMSRKNAEYFRSLLKVKEIGNHGFYIERPKTEERTTTAKVGDNVIQIPAHVTNKKERHAGKHGLRPHKEKTHEVESKPEKKRAARG